MFFCFLILQIAPLPKYTQISINVTSSYVDDEDRKVFSTIGSTNLFALTDVAVPSFLNNLYNIPKGTAVKHGSNQSVVEFYGEVFLFFFYFFFT